MRFGIWPHGHRPWPDLLALARHAAATGWDSIWFGDDPEPALECWAVVAALSAATEGVRLGALVDGDRDRHPAVVAKLATTVDHLSGGRVILGLAPGRRTDGRARLEEACQVVEILVDTDRTTLRGRFYRLHDAPLDPKPLQRPLPLLLHDDGNDTLAMAARYATHWSVAGTPDEVARSIKGLHQACRALGRDPAGLAVSVRADEDPPADTAALRDLLERYRDAGADEWVLPERSLGLDALDRIITEVAPALR